MTHTVTQNLQHIRTVIMRTPRASQEASQNIELIAVSKGHASARIAEALNAGQRLFGENRVQEAQQKWEALKRRYPDSELHLIGQLQTNKVEDAVALFDVIQTVDRVKLVDTLAAAMHKQNRHLPCFIQVNIGDEPQKAGISPEEISDFIRYCRSKKLNIIGLMCIPPFEQDPAPHFARLKELAAAQGLKKLSMGMSGDYETAIQCGATHIRVGTALFGERN